MPELPEVETIRRGLRRELRGARLTAVDVHDRRLRLPVDRTALERLNGRCVDDVLRRGKYLVIALRGGGGLLLHLGMSGQVLLLEPGSPLHRHDHVCWTLVGAGAPEPLELRFRDQRRFGMVLSRSRGSIVDHPVLSRLGPEPFDSAFTGGYLRRRAEGSRRPVKNMLMDPTVVAGLGNIYVNEALWVAGVNPHRRSGRVSGERYGHLAEAVRQVLDSAIVAGGTTLSDFRNAEGDVGYFQVELQVYGRAGSPCPRCARPLRRTAQAGRSTFYCPQCQR